MSPSADAQNNIDNDITPARHKTYRALLEALKKPILLDAIAHRLQLHAHVVTNYIITIDVELWAGYIGVKVTCPVFHGPTL